MTISDERYRGKRMVRHGCGVLPGKNPKRKSTFPSSWQPMEN